MRPALKYVSQRFARICEKKKMFCRFSISVGNREKQKTFLLQIFSDGEILKKKK